MVMSTGPRQVPAIVSQQPYPSRTFTLPPSCIREHHKPRKGPGLYGLSHAPSHLPEAAGSDDTPTYTPSQLRRMSGWDELEGEVSTAETCLRS